MTATAMATALLTPFAPRTWVVVPEAGEDVVAALRWFAMDEELGSATMTAVGSLSRMVVAGPVAPSGRRPHVRVDEPVDLLSLAGTVATESSGRPGLHVTVVASRGDHTVIGGLLVEAAAGPVLEMVVREEPAHLCRRIDDRSGLPLLAGRRGDRSNGDRQRGHLGR